MNGVITITDGEATLENGDLNCNDITSDTLNTTNLISTIFTCNGEIRSNLVGPYTIPVSTSALTGSLISYGNTSNSGATDFTNYGSTYNLLKQGFYFNNINSTTTLTNLAIIDNSQTYFKSQLVGCTAETPLNTTSIVNKTYCDSNFVDRTNNLTQDINGDKTFTNSNLTVFNLSTPSLYLRTSLTGTAFSYIRFSGTSFAINNQNSAGTILFQTNANTRATINSTQLLLTSTTFLTTNDMKSRAPTDAHSLLSDITTGTLAISSATATNTINGATQLNQQTTFNNFTPISSVVAPTAANHLTRKDYCDGTFVDRVNTLAQGINGIKTFSENVICSVVAPTAVNHLTRKDYCDNTFLDRVNNLGQGINGIKTFSENVICSTATPIAVNHLTRKDYVDNNFVDRVNNLQQNINGQKTFTNNTNFTATLLARTNIKLSEYENSPLSNNVTLSFPMPETIALRTTSLTNNNMTVTLPTLSNNERGYVFTFNKLLNPTYGNFNVTFQTSGGNYIFTLLDQTGTPTSNTTLLSIDKIQCKLAVGFFGTINYWVEQTDFSTFDRSKLQFYEWQNATTTNSLTLSFPLPPTIALRASTPSMMTITLPILTTSHRGQIFTFVKVNTLKFDVTFNTSNSQLIFPLNNLSGIPTTNTTIFPSTKATTRLAVGWFSTFTYWIEVSDYSTFDRDENNLIYPRLAIGNTFTNINTFSSSLISNNLTTPLITGTNNIYTTLTTGIINFGSVTSSCNFDSETNFNSDVTIGSNIYCDTAIYFKDIGIGSQSNQARIFKQDDYLFFDTNIDYTNGYTFRTSSLDIFTITQTETTTNNQLTCNSSLYLRDSANQTKLKQVNTDLEIQNEVVSGAINFSTTDSLSSLATRASILEDQFYFQVPLTISIGASLYSSFTSGTIGYKTSNTGSSQTLTSTAVNSGQLVSLGAGVWKIDYTATINITTTMTTLTTLEVFLASSGNVDLDIQGLDVKNFYGVGVTATQKIKISASGTLINSGSPATYNLRLIPVFTGGAGNFVGSISATRLT
jgi:hypothetical protein